MELVIQPGLLGLTDYGTESTTSGSAGPTVGGLHKCEGGLTVCIPLADSMEVQGHAAPEEGCAYVIDIHIKLVCGSHE